MYDIVKFWLDKGIDGFRMDVANLYSKVEGLPDGGPGYENVGTEFYQDGPRIHEFHHEMYEKVTSKYDIMTVGEMSGVPLEEALKYVGNDREELNMVFQFDQNLIDGEENDHWAHRTVPLPELKAVFSKWQNGVNGKGWNSLYWTNHDQPRTVSRWGNDGAYRKESQKMLYTMLLTLQGTPYIYQGEEIGMTNVSFDSIDDYDDVEIHNMWQERVVKGGADPEETLDNIRYRARDNARTPMQWDDTENAGFTTGTPWLKVNPNYKEINAKEALADPDSIFHYMQRLIRMRKSTPAAIYGDFKEYEPENESLYIYERNYEGAKLFVVLNFTDKEVSFSVPETVDASAAKLLISNYDGEKKLTDGKLLPYEGQVYLI